jgi:RNA recognition motif-containing protein
MREEFGKIAPVVFCKYIKANEARMGAECGSIFLEFADPEGAKVAKFAMSGKRYDEKDLKIIEVSEEVFYNDIIS